jgi:hypothetical protein
MPCSSQWVCDTCGEGAPGGWSAFKHQCRRQGAGQVGFAVSLLPTQGARRQWLAPSFLICSLPGAYRTIEQRLNMLMLRHELRILHVMIDHIPN